MHDSHLQKHLTSQERLHAQQQQVIQKQLSEHQAATLKLQQQSQDLVLQHQKQLGASQQTSQPASRPTVAPVLSLQHPNAKDELVRQKELLEQTTAQVEHTLVQLSRARKVHRMVCREASALLDPPFVRDQFVAALQAASKAVAAQGFVYLEAPRAWTDEELAASGLVLYRHLKAGAVHAHLLQRST